MKPASSEDLALTDGLMLAFDLIDGGKDVEGVYRAVKRLAEELVPGFKALEIWRHTRGSSLSECVFGESVEGHDLQIYQTPNAYTTREFVHGDLIFSVFESGEPARHGATEHGLGVNAAAYIIPLNIRRSLLWDNEATGVLIGFIEDSEASDKQHVIQLLARVCALAIQMDEARICLRQEAEKAAQKQSESTFLDAIKNKLAELERNKLLQLEMKSLQTAGQEWISPLVSSLERRVQNKPIARQRLNAFEALCHHPQFGSRIQQASQLFKAYGNVSHDVHFLVALGLVNMNDEEDISALFGTQKSSLLDAYSRILRYVDQIEYSLMELQRVLQQATKCDALFIWLFNEPSKARGKFVYEWDNDISEYSHSIKLIGNDFEPLKRLPEAAKALELVKPITVTSYTKGICTEACSYTKGKNKFETSSYIPILSYMLEDEGKGRSANRKGEREGNWRHEVIGYGSLHFKSKDAIDESSVNYALEAFQLFGSWYGLLEDKTLLI